MIKSGWLIETQPHVSWDTTLQQKAIDSITADQKEMWCHSGGGLVFCHVPSNLRFVRQTTGVVNVISGLDQLHNVIKTTCLFKAYQTNKYSIGKSANP